MAQDIISIRGWGAVTTLGWSANETARNLIAGHTHPAARCQSSHLINREYKAFEVAYSGSVMEKSAAMIDCAIREAFTRAELSADEIAESCLLVGTTGGLFIRNEHEFTEYVKNNPQEESPAIACRNRGPGEVSDWIAAKYGIRGMAMTLSMACVSSSHALVIASQLLAQKKVERAIIVGYEPLLNLTLHGFASLLLYDDEKCRPFCNKRSGMQIGEGAAVVIMERSKGSSPGKTYYRFAGGYLFNDTASLTSAGVDGELVRNVIQRSLSSAGISAGDIVAIKAHGTGTRDNDLSEGRGMVKLFGDKLPPVVSLKGALGHQLGAAGAVETAVWLSCLEKGTIPRSFGFEEFDAEIGFIPSQINTPAMAGAYLFTFFGFGGTCTSYVVIKN
ncbi:MAG TPA: beta-ketoacyl synthase N-terminal-like domain-containing protein [Smithellaceae bacterium]|nr:beta-ketoacyl synthase N-terminal-like domain-containing protein [Smithellaceae bacterium]